MKRFLPFSFLLACALANPAQALAPLTLEQALARALDTHPEMRISREQLKAAQLQVDDARSTRIQATAELTALERRSQSGLLNSQLADQTSDQNTANATVGLTVPLFTGFKLTEGIKAAERGREEVLAKQRSAESDLAYRVTQAFFDLHRQELLEGLREEALRHARKNLELTQKANRLGRTSLNEVDRVELSEMTSEGEVLAAKTKTLEARSRLASLLGMPREDLSIDPSGAIERTKPARLSLESLLEQHPRLKAARAKLETDKAMLAVARGDLWPQLALVSTYQHGNNPSDPVIGARGLSNSFSGTWDIRLATTLNLFDGGKTLRKIARSEGDIRISEAELVKTRQEVRAEIEQVLARLEGACERLQLAEKSTKVAERTLGWMEKRYEQGYALQVEVNEVRANWISSKTQAIDALIEVQIARAELKRSLGTL
ncbi:MAG: TolC family protein [Bacteroidota bacterium]